MSSVDSMAAWLDENLVVSSVVLSAVTRAVSSVEWTVVPKAGQWEHYSADLSVVSLAE